MARGFESKDVEFQQAEAERRNAGRDRAESSPDARARRVARTTIELAIVSVRHDLAAATSPAHRRMLEQALADLERRLGADLVNG